MPLDACITACHSTRLHIVALEGNKDIYNAIFKPMKKPLVFVVAILGMPTMVVKVSQDLDDIPMVPQKFVC